MIPEPSDQQGHRKRRGSRSGRPVGLDAADYKGRNVIERRYCHIKQWRGLATRYDKLAITYRAAVILNAVIAWTRQLSDMPYVTPWLNNSESRRRADAAPPRSGAPTLERTYWLISAMARSLDALKPFCSSACRCSVAG